MDEFTQCPVCDAPLKEGRFEYDALEAYTNGYEVGAHETMSFLYSLGLVVSLTEANKAVEELVKGVKGE